MMRNSPVVRLALVLPLAGCVGQEVIPSGEALYRRNCASCHGVTGRGDGPAAASLRVPATDLTQLRMSVQELMQVIDGRTPVQAHGSSEMPVWGEVFEQIHLDSDHAKRIVLLEVQALADYTAGLSKSQPAAPPN